MSNILITGKNSFVGRNFILHSSNNNVEEASLLNYKPGTINFKEINVVIHVAAIVHQSKEIPESEYYEINKDLTLSVAREAKAAGVKQFVFLSTVKVYGDYNPDFGPWTEKSECHPNDPYGKSKYEAELELKKLIDKNFVVSIIRTPLVYGKEVKANMLRILKLVDKVRVLPFGKIDNKRSFTYSKNLVGFIDRIIEKKASGVFIAMDAAPLSTTELVVLINKYLGKKTLLIKIPGPIIWLGKKALPSFFDRLYGSFEMENSKTLEQLDFKPEYTTEKGIKEMVKSYITQRQKR